MGIPRVFITRWRDGVFIDCLSLLSRRDKIKVLFVFIIQVFLGALDLIGIALVGVLGALSINGIKSTTPGNRTAQILDFFQLGNSTFQEQVAWLGATAGAFLLLRTIASMILTRKTISFLSFRSSQISTALISKLLNQPLIKIQSRNTQESLYACTIGVSTIVLGVIATGVSVLSDLVLTLVICTGLFIVDPTIAISTLAFFMILSVILYVRMHSRASELGRKESEISIATNKKLLEVLNLYRESIIRNRRWFYSEEIGKLREKLAKVEAEKTFLPHISKYILESGIVVGAVLICAVQFSTQDSVHAVASIGIFLAAGSRLAPALLRMQQGAVHMRNSIGVASPTLSLMEDLEGSIAFEKSSPDFVYTGFVPSVSIQNVSLQYQSRSELALQEINLNVSPGEIVAIVGPSGAGKTSLVDVLLGSILPTEGIVLISNEVPESAVVRWPGAIAYVPQDVYITEGSIRENIAIGLPRAEQVDSRIFEALQAAQLEEFILNLPDGVDTQVGEHGAALSGGQRQRIGIARALYTNPKLIVFDEATSALDADTEDKISNAVFALRRSHTLIIIAHRLSTVRNADSVIYLDGGKILAKGSFDQVRAKIPEFDNQANLMGL
jgi:ABC-type multidrug transport system fused ATPase/permease subunit